MKLFYICPKCGESFCLKGNKYCRDNSGVLCNCETPAVKMQYVGDKYADLQSARERMKK